MNRQQGMQLLSILDKLDQLTQPSQMARRIQRCHEALALVSKQTQAQIWALLQAELGDSLLESPFDERAENLEQAIVAYEKALQIMTAQTRALVWAQTYADLGHAYRNRVRGARADNIERAMAAYQKALQVYSREVMPVEWAQTINRLAIAYSTRIQGERAENIEQAISLYQQALAVSKQQGMPLESASTMMNLGNAYHNRVRGRRADNIEQAISLYQQALQGLTRQETAEWGTTMRNLASAYLDRVDGKRADNIEQAISACQQALQAFTRQDRPSDWAGTKHNLATAYYSRIRGDRADNIERAIAASQQALQVFTRAAFPSEWAAAMTNLAIAYSTRIRGDQAENLEQAIAAFEQALQVRTRQAFPFEWAETMQNLAAVYYSRLRGDPADNIERAIEAYQKALQVLTYESRPLEWGYATNNLANAICERIRGSRAQNIEQAIATYQQALNVMTRQTMPLQWAQTMHNLAATIYLRVHGERRDNIQQAIAAYQQALQVHKREAMPNEHRQIQRNLAGLHFRERHWAEATTAYRAALAAGDLLYQESATPSARQAELHEVRDLPARAAYCLAKAERVTEAVEILERNRSRALAEALARNEAALESASAEERSAFVKARERIRVLTAEARATSAGLQAPATEARGRDFLVISAELGQARQELNAIVQRLRKDVPEFMPQGLNFNSVAAIARELSHPLLYLLTTEHGSLALIVRPDQSSASINQPVEVVWLDEFQSDQLDSILHQENRNRYLYGTLAGKPLGLKKVLDDIWPQLARLMTPITAYLRQLGYRQAILIPVGMLTLLPLHAITLSSLTFALAPSARALQTAPTKTPLEPRLLGIGNPLPNPKPLPFARLEVEEISPLFTTAHTFYEKAATHQAVKASIAGTTHLHFSCHGTFNLLQPLNSALHLAGNDQLTLRELLAGELNLSTARLAVLSACQTGITDFQNVPDEAIGFPASFLQAGVPGVISTLWPVPDISTAFLLARFYRYHITDDLAPALALHKAQCWLRQATTKELKLADYYKQLFQNAAQREERAKAFVAMRHYQAYPDAKPFEHPYYWAAFVFSGV